ncbi:MAG: CoB--CoM heterodisulfide reductase iron-sulfur subunit A family protein [Syntrophobacteraceae bacterium]
MAEDNAQRQDNAETGPRVGVYVCHCGGNISDHVDVEEVCRRVGKLESVVVARSNSFMCSDPGQEMIMEDLKGGNVDRIVVASCAPSLHETTFRNTVRRAGANSYIYEHANIREQVSWVHQGPGATEKAIRLIAAAAAKAERLQPLDPIRVETVKHATVVGGGVAGLKAAHDLALRGIRVALIEKSPCLGGRTAQLDRLAPGGESAADVLSELTGEISNSSFITVHTSAQIKTLEGYIGNFRIGFKSERPESAPEEFTLETGIIILATGFRPYAPRSGEFGFGNFSEVITLPDLIDLLAKNEDTGDYLHVNGRKIRSVAMIHCVGSRMIPGIHEEDDRGRLNEYCSRTCCSATLQASVLIREKHPGTSVFEFYRDIRTYGRGQEELYEKASDNRVIFLRFRPEDPPVIERDYSGGGYPLIVKVRDLLTFGEEIEAPVDLVVLSVGMEPNDISGLVNMMKLPVGEDGFLQEVHPKLRPVELSVAGILLAGTCQAPMDVGEACTSASAAAVKAAILLSRDCVELDPFIADVDMDKCAGDGACVEACLREGAIRLVEIAEAGENVRRAQVNPALCLGCGACVAVCPEGAIEIKGWTLGQYEAMVDAITSNETLDQGQAP